MGRSLAILAALLAACTTMDHERVEGWPELDIVEHYVPAEAMLERETAACRGRSIYAGSKAANSRG